MALYLLLTMAPFAVVAPLLGPVLDRSRSGRRAVVVLCHAGRAVVCLFMARQLPKKSFRSYMLANLKAHHLAAMPVLYRLA